jgi:putative ABC transport system permease protein
LIFLLLELWSACCLAARRLARAPGFSLVIIAVLSAGIGSNTIVFWLVHAVLLKPLPYPAASGLLHLTTFERSRFGGAGCLSYAHLLALQGVGPDLADVAGYANETFNQIGRNGPIQREAARVSANFFRVLGIKPLVGRSFTPAEDTAGRAAVVMLGERFWRRNFAGDPHMIGQQINLDSRLYTVVGVLPPNFQFGLLGSRIDIWTPSVTETSIVTPQQVQTGACYLNAVARLTPSISLRKAQTAFAIRRSRFLREYPQYSDADPKRSLEAIPLAEKLVGNYRPFCLVLAGTVALFLLISCANVACLLLARATNRLKQFSIQVALGATRGRVILDSLLDSLLLSVAGGLLGLLITAVGRGAISRLILQALPNVHNLEIGHDGAFLLLALSISAVTALLCSVIPVLHLFGGDLDRKLREAGRGAIGVSRHQRIRTVLVVGQISVTIPLLVGCGLLARSFLQLKKQNLGFQPQSVLTTSISLPKTKYASPEQIFQFFDQALTGIRSLPGAENAALSSALPLNATRLAHVLAEGEQSAPVAARRLAAVQSVSPSYSQLLRIPLVQGRFFAPSDKRGTLQVAVINQTFANEFFHSDNPLGKHLWLGKGRIPWQVVGIIGDVKNAGLSTPAQPEVDVPFAQLPWSNMNLLLRTRILNGLSLVGPVRKQIFRQDREQSITDAQMLPELVGESLTQSRLSMNVLAIFSALAFLLAATGIYGVVSYDAVKRKQEFGIRIALGATRRQLVGRVLRHGLGIASLGIAIGLAGALAVTRLMVHLLFQVSTYDVWAFLLGPLLLMLIASAASLFPALQTTRLEPAGILRTE